MIKTKIRVEPGNIHEDITLEDIMIISRDPSTLTKANLEGSVDKQITILKDKCEEIALKNSEWRIKVFKLKGKRILDTLLCILKNFFGPFLTFFLHFKRFSVIFHLKSRKNI